MNVPAAFIGVSLAYVSFAYIVTIAKTGPAETQQQRIANLYLGAIATATIAIAWKLVVG